MPALYLATNRESGDECSSTYEGRHITLEESYLTHPTHADGFVDKGDPVQCGHIVGVALKSAAAATDLIPLDTEGIWFLSATAVDAVGNSAIAPGDELFINKTTGVISKDSDKNTNRRFGYALGDVGSGLTAVVAVKVHWVPNDAEEVVGDTGANYISSLADKIFRHYRYQCSATSGDARGIYNRLYITGAGGGGESLRSFTTVNNVAGATAHGAHISLNFNTSGRITGLGVAGRNTLHIPNAAMAAGGTYAAVQAEIYSDGTSSDPAAVTELAFLRLINDGHANGISDVDDKAFLMALIGGSIGAGNVMAVKTAAAVSHTLRMKGPDGNTYYLMVSDAQ